MDGTAGSKRLLTKKVWRRAARIVYNMETVLSKKHFLTVISFPTTDQNGISDR
jgi:hypothetical protein